MTAMEIPEDMLARLWAIISFSLPLIRHCNPSFPAFRLIRLDYFLASLF
jgi:hypothetical protein